MLIESQLSKLFAADLVAKVKFCIMVSLLSPHENYICISFGGSTMPD